MVSDKQLMQAVAAGDPDAFHEIILRHQQVAWNTAYRFLGDPMDAEDIVQETFLRILEAAPRYQPRAKFRTYLYRILIRLCIDHARKKRPLFVDSVPDIEDSAPGPLEDLILDQRGKEVHAHLDALPPKQKAAIILKHFEGLSYAEISQVMGITKKAVERLLSRARSTLQTRLSHLKKI
jgi:RNA polymerase sigma-70 factor (ECF subfamily)